MALNKAQLMDVPGGPGVVGAIKAGTGIAIAADGTVSVNPATTITRLVAGSNVSLDPDSGFGVVTINAAGGDRSDIPIGSKTVFAQAAAPTGWSKDTSVDNATIRLVSGNGGGTGGSVNFTTAFANQPVTGNVTTSSLSVSGSTNTVSITPSGNVSLSGLSAGSTSLTTNMIPSHSHTYDLPIYRCPQPGAQSLGSQNPFYYNAATGSTGNTGGNGGHTHNVSGSGSFSGSASNHSHNVSASVSGTATFSGTSIDLAVKYVDVILCTKTA